MLPVKPNYPPKYPLSNDLDTHSQQAKRAWVSNGGLPVPTTDPKAGVDQYYQKAGEGHADVAKNKTNNKGMKKADAKSIGSKVFEQGQDVVGFIKKFDPQNTSGTIPFALDLVKQIQSSSGPAKMLSDIVGQNLSDVMGQFTNLLMQNLPDQAQNLGNLIQSVLQLKRRIEELSANPTADPQILGSLQQELATAEQQLKNLNSSGI